MVRIPLSAYLAAVAVLSGLCVPLSAQAQIGTIFSDPAPRPPANVPRGNAPDSEEEDVPDLPQGRVLPTPNRLPPGTPAPLPGAVQSQPLAPPPGAAVAPPNHQPPIAPPGTAAATPPAGNAPGQRPGRNAPPAPATLQPGDEVVTEPPAQKIANKEAVFSGLDKITGRIISFDAAIGETVQFGALRVKPQACYTRPATEAANTDAFVEVEEITLQGEVKRIFSGWMFAASPGLHGVEHPIYDVWLTDCKGPTTTIVSAQPDPPKPPPPAPQKRANPSRQSSTQRPVAPPPSQPAPPPQPSQPSFFPTFRQ